MAFVKFQTVFSDYYFPEHKVLEMVVTSSDNPERGPHMTIIKSIGSDGVLQEDKFYSEPVFV